MRIGSARERVLLAALLVDAPRLVTVDELVDRLWGARAPVHPRAALHTLVTRLRQRLGEHDLITTEPAGYAIAPGHLDLDEFRAQVATADRAALAGDTAAEAAQLRAGLALWRGPVLVDAPSDALHRTVVPVLVEERLAALQRRIALDLTLDHASSRVPGPAPATVPGPAPGHGGALVAELRGLTAEFPLREWFWASLMTALHRADRQAEALAAYEAVRRRLVDELGVEPGPQLRRAHAEVLAGELRPAAGDPRPAPRPVRRPAPRSRPALSVVGGRR